MTALVVDDEPSVRGVVAAALQGMGYQVDEAESALDAVRLFRERNHALVVTDILMPDVGGLTLIRSLRSLSRDVKILAISGGGQDGKMSFLSTARTFPGVDALSKPFRIAALREKVEALLATPSPA